MKDAIGQLIGARARYKERCHNIGEPVVAIPLEYLSVTQHADGEYQVFISIKDVTELVRSILQH